LPGDVYVRGFFKRYANYLGLDGEKLLAPYLALTESAQPGSSSDRMSGRGGGGGGDQNIALWVGVVIVGLLALALINILHNRRSSTPALATADVAAVPAATVALSSETVRNAANENEHLLSVYSSFPLWLQVRSQSRTFEGFIPRAATWTWKGEGKFQIRLGHSREIVMIFDGQPVALAENQKRINLPNDN
jgi:hypothetical protein